MRRGAGGWSFEPRKHRQSSAATAKAQSSSSQRDPNSVFARSRCLSPARTRPASHLARSSAHAAHHQLLRRVKPWDSRSRGCKVQRALGDGRCSRASSSEGWFHSSFSLTDISARSFLARTFCCRLWFLPPSFIALGFYNAPSSHPQTPPSDTNIPREGHRVDVPRSEPAQTPRRRRRP